MRDQLRRTAISVMNNISECNDRDVNNEFGQFLSIAREEVLRVN
jgi:four helix bundle protein